MHSGSKTAVMRQTWSIRICPPHGSVLMALQRAGTSPWYSTDLVLVFSCTPASLHALQMHVYQSLTGLPPHAPVQV